MYVQVVVTFKNILMKISFQLKVQFPSQTEKVLKEPQRFCQVGEC